MKNQQITVEIISPGEDYRAALPLREEVFSLEQGFAAPDTDHWDEKAWHIVLRWDGVTVGVARVFFEGEQGEVAHYGRLCVKKSYRRQGVAQALMAELEKIARRQKAVKAVLGAQAYAVPVYERSGFRASGEVFMEEHALHVHMEKQL